MKRPFTASRRALAGLLLCSLLLSLAGMELAARLIFAHWRDYHAGRFLFTRLSPEGYMFTAGLPGFDGYFAENNGDFRIHVRLNEQGFRVTEPITSADKRTWFIGDSFTFGWGVEAEESFGAQAGAQTGQPIYNLASPGTDLCGYRGLAALVPPGIQPRAVVIGLTLENDVLVYDCYGAAPPAGTDATSRSRFIALKEMLTGTSALYNLIVVALKQSAGLRQAMESAGLVEAAHRPAPAPAVDTAALASTVSELRRLRAMFPVQAPFAVLLIPARLEVRNADPAMRELRQRAAAALQAEGIDVIDPFPALAAQGFAATHFAHDGHWSARGHHLAADAVSSWMMTKVPPQ